MPISLEILERRGVTNKRLAAVFSPDVSPDPDKFDSESEGRQKITKEDIDRCKKLQNRLRSRVQEGMTRNLSDWRVWHALDLARNTPFRQVNPTLLQSMIGDGHEVFKEGDDVFKKLEALGLGESTFVEDVLDEKGGKTNKKRINAPAFFNILVPLCRAYGDIVWSKIINERDQFPLFQYDPSYSTTANKAKCEVLTNRVQVMATQYSFFEVLKQCCLKMVHYGTCLQFPKEEWHSEKQVSVRKATESDVAKEKRNSDGKIVSVGDEIEDEQIDREGLRYHLPHPTRTFRDLAHGCYTYNSDSGAMFAGYWQIVRYRDLIGVGYWATDKIKQGVTDITSQFAPFFQTIYSACKLKIPYGAAAAAEAGLGADRHDAERKLSDQFYGTDQLDQGCLVTEYFEKLKPSEWGLGNYTDYVWFRFVLAGDGCTVLYAAPLPYCPVIYYGYNPDESQDKNSTVTLEVLPFQDQFGMMLSQIILSAKQNLANLTMVNTEIMDEKDIEKLSNKGERWYRFINIVGRNFKNISKRLGLKKFENDDVFQSWTLPKANTAELVNVLKTILDVLERVMQIASQEMGQQASHEQPAAEIKVTAAASSARNMFIGKSVDLAVDAWKRQIYLGLMAYGDDEFYAHIPADPPLAPEQLKALGFTAEPSSPGDENIRVRVKKGSIIHPLYEFASTGSDLNRHSDAKTAAAMAAILQPMMQNPVMLKIMGAKQILELTNRIAHLAGIDRDFNLKPMSNDVTGEDEKKQAADQLKQLLDTVSKMVDQKMMGDLAPLLKMVKESEAVISLIIHTLNIPKDLVDQTLATVDKPQPPQPQPNPQNAPPPAPIGAPA